MERRRREFSEEKRKKNIYGWGGVIVEYLGRIGEVYLRRNRENRIFLYKKRRVFRQVKKRWNI